MTRYTLGLFANLYPSHDGDSRGVFVKRMVDDLERCDVRVIKAVKDTTKPLGYGRFFTDSLLNSLNRDIDILQAEYIPHSSIIPCLLKNKRPLVLKFHGDDALIYPFKNIFNRNLINYSLKKADHVITCSEALKNTIIALGYDKNKVTAIPNGVDTNIFRPMNKSECRRRYNLPEDESICLFAGRIHPMKGIKEIITSAGKNPDIIFVLAGPGEIPGHPKNCIFFGDISPNEMPELMNTADFLILPSYSEGFGLVLIESLACEVPVIASNVGGCPEIIKNGHTGILIEPKNTQSLSSAINYMKINSEQRKLFGINGRNYVIKKYDSRLSIKYLTEIHESLI